MSDDAIAASRDPTGDSANIERHVQQWARLIGRCASRAGLSGSDAEELVQDVRIKVWKSLEREKSSTLAASYMYRLVMSVAVDFLRRKRSRREARHVHLDRVEPVAAAEGRDLEAALGGALSGLSPDRCVAVRLHLEGKSLEEIAGLLDWTAARARNLVYRGLADVRAHLSNS